MEKILKIEKELLPQSVIYNISLDGNDTFYANNIFTHNTPPHMPPLQAIKEWLQVKGLPKEMAYPVAKQISEQGTRPQPFIRPYMNNVMISDLKKALSEYFK